MLINTDMTSAATPIPMDEAGTHGRSWIKNPTVYPFMFLALIVVLLAVTKCIFLRWQQIIPRPRQPRLQTRARNTVYQGQTNANRVRRTPQRAQPGHEPILPLYEGGYRLPGYAPKDLIPEASGSNIRLDPDDPNASIASPETVRYRPPPEDYPPPPVSITYPPTAVTPAPTAATTAIT